MIKVLLTGAFGNVGLSTIEELLKKDYLIRIFEIFNKKNSRIAKNFSNPNLEIIWGDIRDYKMVEQAVKGVDVVLHVAGIIPPLADKLPEFAESINVGGTINIIKAIEKQQNKPKLVFTSSISVYGDRLKNPYIKLSDPLTPSKGDHYAEQKIKCETLIRESSLEFAIFRLSYITSMDKLQLDPIMYDVPLDTCLEICDTKDVGLALANAVESRDIWDETLHIAGGEQCRTTYREYLSKMLDLFGVGTIKLPNEAFATGDFHCGYMTTNKSQKFLKFQRTTLKEYYNQVKAKVRNQRFWGKLFRPIARFYVLSRSPYLKQKRRSDRGLKT
ncbi:NAD-dependent epimerase/dehydratase family protein [Promethearchaeum syntrophicum]|uniref:NAD-dependent epimerase/dehydratase family protein n=1 Tax=Promethearchaeum syntrophicum TaxID=2594042 RepID=A0A5B9D5C3_9ARCH|nr:NAD(P)-dependent oxidoreductase [Candidatus Prometheoarchaeum syntrophicum]QEE14235.1 UDP-galactose-4-epimerase [Candidatus Prometheoarchaeum syntrophicum]